MVTFDQLCEVEPKLRALWEEARAVKDDKSKPLFCANAFWYGWRPYKGFKPRLVRLVGQFARKPALRTKVAYDVGYQEVYHQLPNCRNCWCF